MIYNLLTAITNLLKTELSAYLPQSDKHFILAQLTTSPPKPYPKISIYTGKFILEQTIKEGNVIKSYPDENRQEIIAVREFTQDFFIEIYDENLSNIEKISSLLIGAILTDSENLIQQYNVATTTNYQSQQTTTSHLINKVNILEGNYKTSEDTLSFEIKLQVKGRLNLLRNIAGTVQPIKTITISDK